MVSWGAECAGCAVVVMRVRLSPSLSAEGAGAILVGKVADAGLCVVVARLRSAAGASPGGVVDLGRECNMTPSINTALLTISDILPENIITSYGNR